MAQVIVATVESYRRHTCSCCQLSFPEPSLVPEIRVKIYYIIQSRVRDRIPGYQPKGEGNEEVRPDGCTPQPTGTCNLHRRGRALGSFLSASRINSSLVTVDTSDETLEFSISSDLP
jgi:hypothetical protein